MDDLATPGEFASIPDDELMRMIADALLETAASIARLARMIRVAESRGIRIEMNRSRILPWLRKIASGQVLPELVHQFRELPAALDRVGNLPLADQETIARDQEFPVVEIIEREPAVRKLRPSQMLIWQIRQVFDGHVLNPDEQIVRMKRARRESLTLPDITGVTVDPRRHVATINGLELTRKQLYRILTAIG